MDHIKWETIPYHILVNVFTYLSVNDRLSASLACKSWSECFHSPMLWSKFVFKFDTDIDSEGKAINCIEKYCDTLKDVKILVNQAQAISRDRACHVMEELTAVPKKKLQKFAFEFTGTNPLCFQGNAILSQLKKLFAHTSNSELVFHLTYIDLNHCNIAFDNELVSIFASQHQALKVFKIQNSCLVDNVTPSSMLDLVKNCRFLSELHTFYHCINAAVLTALSEKNRSTFNVLSLMCNRSDKYNDLITTDPWLEFSLANPNAEVTIKFHSSTIHHKIIPLLCPGIPLASLDLKVYSWLAEELEHVAFTFSSYLKYLSFHPSMDWTLKAPPGVEPALLQIAARCELLKELHCHCALKKDVIDNIKAMRSLENFTLYQHKSELNTSSQLEND